MVGFVVMSAVSNLFSDTSGPLLHSKRIGVRTPFWLCCSVLLFQFSMHSVVDSGTLFVFVLSFRPHFTFITTAFLNYTDRKTS